MGEIVNEIDGSVTTYDFVEPREETLLALFRELFERHWASLRFGPCIQGAVYELVLERAPKVTVLDGYLTVDAGSWHVHLCLGEHRGAREEARRVRRASRVAFFHTRNVSCVGESYGLRAWNGAGEQMITIFFPNPWLDDALRRRREPDPSRLELWRTLRERYAGIAAGDAGLNAR